MSRDRYKYLKYSRNLYQNISKKKRQKIKKYEKVYKQDISEKDKQKNERTHERIQKINPMY